MDLATNRGKIYEGSLYKRGRYTKSWKLRWFILYDTRQLACYNDKNTTQKAIEEIDLTKVENIINDRSKDVKNKYVFELITNSRSFYLACLDKQSLDLWVQHLLQMVFGRQIHVGWLIKKGVRTQSWRKRWFTLSDLKELRYYEDETQKKYKGTIDLSQAFVIRYGDKEQYGYEYTMEIVTPDRIYVLVTTYSELRELWMDKLYEETVTETYYCSVCDPQKYLNSKHGIKFKIFLQNKFQNLELSTDMLYGVVFKHDMNTLHFINESHESKRKKLNNIKSTICFDIKYYHELIRTMFDGSIYVKQIKQIKDKQWMINETDGKWIMCSGYDDEMNAWGKGLELGVDIAAQKFQNQLFNVLCGTHFNQLVFGFFRINFNTYIPEEVCSLIIIFVHGESGEGMLHGF